MSPKEPLWAPHVLREYALLADGERGALIGPRGEIAWLCVPRWHSPAAFAALNGAGGGFSIQPTGRWVWGGYYEQGTLIWHSRWITETGIVECEEALALPADPDTAVLLRRIVAVEGPAEVAITLEACDDFGKRRMRKPRGDDGGGWQAVAGDVHLEVSGLGGVHVDGSPPMLRGSMRLAPGESRDIVLRLRRGSSPAPPSAPPHVLWQATREDWRSRVPPLSGRYAQRDAQHAFAVLSGLTSMSGGMVAATTLGLPERADKGRNYDYRYAWIRDQCYAGRAVALAGDFRLLDSAVRFVSSRVLEHGPNLAPAYTTAGAPVPDESVLELPAYPGGRDVIGNRANAQFQLDGFAETLLLLATADAHDRLDSDGWQAVQIAVSAIEQRWTEPDCGVWELDPQPWTHSRLMCAAGLRAAAGRPAAGQEAPGWLTLADRLVADTAGTSVHPTGRWQRSPADARIDAALLLPALRGALPPDDPRSVATLHAVADELTEDGYVYRFRPPGRPLGEAEGAFVLCGFLLSLAYQQQGDSRRAVRYFERNRAACGPPGLFSEEYDVQQRQLRGNLPQAFVHALMLECALKQEEAG